MYKGKKISAVVPAYNEEGFIELVISNMPDFVDKIYVVNDASSDNTQEITSKAARQDGRLVVITHGENRGVGAAIVTGYKKSLEEDMDIAVVIAGDNQMSGKHLPELLDPIIKGKADYAKGSRLSRPQHRRGMSNWRFFGNWVLTLLSKIASGYWGIRDPQNGYTAITRKALERIDLGKVYPRYGYCNDLLVKLNVARCRVTDIPIPACYGKEISKIKYGKYITTVSPLLLQGFLWRLRMKYFTRSSEA